MLKRPGAALESHVDAIRTAERTAQQYAGAPRHLGIVHVYVEGSLVGGGDAIRRAGADKEPGREVGLRQLLFTPDQLGGGPPPGEGAWRVGREHGGGEPGPGAHALVLAAQPVEKAARDHNREVSFGLPAARGEPDRVDDLP